MISDSNLIILIPVYNDWEPLLALLEKINSMVPDLDISTLIVDDGSTVDSDINK